MARFVLEFDTADYDTDLPDGQTIAGQIGYALSTLGGRISRVGIDANDPRPVLDVNGNTIGQFVLRRNSDSETESERTVRAAWNNYVFARAEVPPGPRMQLVSEADAFEKLSKAFHALTAEWDGR